MPTPSREAIKMMYEGMPDESHLPDEQQRFKQIRAFFQLCLIDNIMSIEQIAALPQFDDYLVYYSQHILPLQMAKVKEELSTLRTQNIQYILNTFIQLEKRSNKTGRIEVCPVKLEMSSGMIESHINMNLEEIQEFLLDVCAGTKVEIIPTIMTAVKNHLKKETLLEQDEKNKSYKIRIGLASNKHVFAHVLHSDKTNAEWRQGVYAFLTYDLQEIANILEKSAILTQDKTLQDAFSPIADPILDDDFDDNEEHA